MIDLSQLKKNDVIVTSFGDIAKVRDCERRDISVYIIYLDRAIRLTESSMVVDIVCNKDGTSVCDPRVKPMRIVKIIKGDSNG